MDLLYTEFGKTTTGDGEKQDGQGKACATWTNRSMSYMDKLKIGLSFEGWKIVQTIDKTRSILYDQMIMMDRNALMADETQIYQPVYNIKAIARMAGLLPVTLRAWERRYGIPQPQRGEQGYRYYSEHDLRTLLWIKKKMESGMSISRAVEGLMRLRSVGKDPVMNEMEESREQPISIQAINAQLYEALLNFDEQSAAEVMRRAFGIYLVDQVLIEIVRPTLVRLGEAWHQGEIPIAKEHFATQFFMQHLMSMISASAPPSHNGTIVAACAPGEMHQIGLLILVVMLRWRGWDVIYLGPDLKLERMAEALIPLKPRLLLFSATRKESAILLDNLAELVEQFPEPHPEILVGGQAWQEVEISENVPATVLDMGPTETVAFIERCMQGKQLIGRG